ncbi:ANTAR domain-containing protein [Luteimicrobium sp. DT211]|uniref:ANTAR domain-containing protein n=1 Tax=Luteimicrobium sp. DT211 TaxID=3393412 RepID=UPI003CF7EEC7
MQSEAVRSVPGARPPCADRAADPTAAAGTTELASGRFQVDADGVRCTWSDELYALHRLAPGDVVPTVDLLLAHQGHRDRDRVRAMIEGARLAGRRSACLSRLVDFAGRTHVVVVRVEPDDDLPGDGPWPVAGWFVLLDGAFDAAVRARVDVQLAQAVESRGAVDRAKGVLTALWRLDPDAAFDLLRLASQARGVKVRALADAVVEGAARQRADGEGDHWLRKILGTRP